VESNFDTVIGQMVTEAKELMAGAKSKQVEAGLKWLAIKDMLLEERGPVKGKGSSNLDIRGKPAPEGWTKFLQEQGYSISRITILINHAVAPEKMKKMERDNTQRRAFTPMGVTQRLRKAWTTMSPEDRETTINIIRKLVSA
jgi:hypothetical protein